jgi:hypothetical protein
MAASTEERSRRPILVPMFPLFLFLARIKIIAAKGALCLFLVFAGTLFLLNGVENYTKRQGIIRSGFRKVKADLEGSNDYQNWTLIRETTAKQIGFLESIVEISWVEDFSPFRIIWIDDNADAATPTPLLPRFNPFKEIIKPQQPFFNLDPPVSVLSSFEEDSTPLPFRTKFSEFLKER